MSKKGQKNGFTCYIIHGLIPELMRAGEQYPSDLQALVPLARPRYWRLSSDEKTKFENMARMERARLRMAVVENQANIMVDVEIRMTLKKQRDRNNLQTRIKTLTNSHDCCKDDPCGHLDLLDMKFYFIGFQYMLRTEDRVYYPLEYGAVEWSMAKGISNTIHGFMNPGEIPLGYRFSVQAHSDDNHRIPLDKFSEGESDYQKIRIKLKRFLCSSPIVYCAEADYKVVIGCLSALYFKCGMTNRIRVGILEELVAVLFLHRGVELSKAETSDILTMTEYDFEVNIKCSQHKEVEAKHCAIGLPKKHAYTLSETLSDLYGFQLTPNHLPAALPSCEASVAIQGWLRRGRGKTVEFFGMSPSFPSQFKGDGGNYFFMHRWPNAEAPRNFDECGHRGNDRLALALVKGNFDDDADDNVDDDDDVDDDDEDTLDAFMPQQAGSHSDATMKVPSASFAPGPLSGCKLPYIQAMDRHVGVIHPPHCSYSRRGKGQFNRRRSNAEAPRNFEKRDHRRNGSLSLGKGSFDNEVDDDYDDDNTLDAFMPLQASSHSDATMKVPSASFAPGPLSGYKQAHFPVMDRHIAVFQPTRYFYSRRGKGKFNRKF